MSDIIIIIIWAKSSVVCLSSVYKDGPHLKVNTCKYVCVS